METMERTKQRDALARLYERGYAAGYGLGADTSPGGDSVSLETRTEWLSDLARERNVATDAMDREYLLGQCDGLRAAIQEAVERAR